MNINFELYKVFYAVANAGSITKGAENLKISQPAVTQSIHTLEDELGGKLFNRTPKGVVLTYEGRELYKYIKEGMTYFINGENKFTSLKNIESGVLKIGSTSIISSSFLIPYIKEFNNIHPNIDINIVNDLTDNLIHSLRNGSLDIIVTSVPKEKSKDIKYNIISDLTDIFVGGVDYKNTNYSSVSDLLKSDILVQKYPSITRKNFDEYLSKNSLSCTPKIEVISHFLLAKLAENNLGIALLTKEFIKDKLNKTLFEINVQINIPKRKLGYAVMNNFVPSFAAKEFINLLNNN